MELGKVIHISQDVIATATVQHNFNNYLKIRFGVVHVASVGYTSYYRVKESKGRLCWNHRMMNLNLGHEVDVETRYDLKIKVDASEAIFEILENEIVDPKCNQEYLLDVYNKFVDKYRKDRE